MPSAKTQNALGQLENEEHMLNDKKKCNDESNDLESFENTFDL